MGTLGDGLIAGPDLSNLNDSIRMAAGVHRCYSLPWGAVGWLEV